ncbi:hypothetical protein ACMHYB_00565 [Sorangium sp. So ce1128]
MAQKKPATGPAPERPPHPATVAQKKPATGPAPERPPHPATVAQKKPATGVPARPPHPTAAHLGQAHDAVQRATDALPGFLGVLSTHQSYAKFADTLIRQAHEHGNPSDVIAYLSYGTKDDPQWFELTADGGANTFAKIDNSAEQEVSKDDGEGPLLSAALRRIVRDHPGNARLVLCGPYGPCHGCKERIGAFVEQWRAASTKAQQLYVYYLYAIVEPKTRGIQRVKTVYGDNNDPRGKVIGFKEENYLYLHTWGRFTGKR